MLTSCIYAAVKYANILPLFRGPSSEAAWSPIVSVPFIFPPNSVKIILPIPAYTASRKLLTFSGMVTNNPHYP